MNEFIGIGISTTPNRSILNDILPYFVKYRPPKSSLFIENDINFKGVARTKNRLLSQLDYCGHIFLFDDDCHPIADNWWKPYIESKEPHLMYQFKLPGKGPDDMKELYRDDKIVSYSHTRGSMIYIKKIVLDTVGGLDESYGKAMFEHTDWTNRIHNAGLTTYRAMDVPESDKFLYCFDQDGKIESSISEFDRAFGLRNNYKKYHKSKTSKEYKAYK